MSFDDEGSIELDARGIYSDDTLIKDNYKLRQLVYNDPYLNGAVTMEFWRDVNSKSFKEDCIVIENVFRRFVKFSNYRLFSVEQFNNHVICKFDLPKTEVPVVPNMPVNLDWLTEVANNKV